MQITKEQVMNATGSELDEMVALAQGWEKQIRKYIPAEWNASDGYVMDVSDYHPSTNGSQCMEIIECEKISVICDIKKWVSCSCVSSEYNATGETAMTAICRCYVLSKLEVINGNNK